MSVRFWAVASLGSLVALLQCGGTVEGIGGNGGASGSAGQGGAGRAGHAGNAAAGATTRPPADAGFDVFVDPGCPDVGQPTRVEHCDPYSRTPNCPLGQGCFPFVDHPFGEGCGVQTFGTACSPAGSGRQGDSCGAGGDGCASGFVCVVGSEPGKHCVALCPIDGPNMCPAGLICGDLDVEGYGVCS